MIMSYRQLKRRWLMLTPSKQAVTHKIQLFRLLREILASNFLANELVFKGGTYASLLNYLDRFSVDLDFDLPNNESVSKIKDECYSIFKTLGLDIKDESKNYLQFFLKYPASEKSRNTLKLEINDTPSKFNTYEKVNLPEINMYCTGHTPDTMFASKLIAAKARFDKNGKIAGRDFYDLHKFFERGLGINKAVVEDLSKMAYVDYLTSLVKFIETNVTDRLLMEDLNPLVQKDQLIKIAKYLRPELLSYLANELELTKKHFS